jgi:hypothetical protein
MIEFISDYSFKILISCLFVFFMSMYLFDNCDDEILGCITLLSFILSIISFFCFVWVAL